MALLDITVDQLDSDLRIQDDAVAYVESSTGIRKHFRYMQDLAKVRVGMQTSPEYMFYDAGTFTNFQWVDLNAAEYTMTTGTAEAGVYDALITAGLVELLDIPAADGDGRLAIAVNADLVETVEIIEDSAGYDKIHLGLMSSNKPDITFIEYTDPVGQWRFNDGNVIEGTGGLAAAYMGDNNYVLNAAAMTAVRTAVLTLA